MKIICVGRNYVDHARELGNDVPSEPVLFMKPDTSLMRPEEKFYIPDWTSDVHYEAEIVVRISRMGKNISARFAHKYYDRFSLGIDFTARDIQSKLKEKGLPWEKAKAFDRSAVVGEWIEWDDQDLAHLPFELQKNGRVVQRGNTELMIFPINELIAHISSYFTLKVGDLIFTGTPAGVGSIAANDILKGSIDGRELFSVEIK